MTDQRNVVRFPGISSRAFEHPTDRAALIALRAIPGFDQIVRAAARMLRERQYRLAFLASSVRVSDRQFGRLHRQLDDVCGVLDTGRPELFVFNDPVPNAITLGVDTPFVAISSGLYELLDADERCVVLGHEVGHAMSGHALYRSMLEHILNLVGSLGWIPASGLALRGLVAGLTEWSRKAELSGDRAGLLVTQDIDLSLRALMKTAGGNHLDEMDVEAFLGQATDYESSGDLRDGVLKLLNTERAGHPFLVVRAAELKRWHDGGEYGAILRGEYPLRSQDAEASFADNAREAARGYRRRIEESGDPLVSTVRNVGSTVGSNVNSAAENIADWFKRRAEPSDEPLTLDPTADEPREPTPPESPSAAPGGDDIFDWFQRRDRNGD